MTTTYQRGPITLGTEFFYPELMALPAPHLADRSTEHTLGKVDRLAEMDVDELTETINEAAQEYGTVLMWRDLPREHQGHTTPLAWRYRDQHAAAAKVVWLAARHERARRFGW